MIKIRLAREVVDVFFFLDILLERKDGVSMIWKLEVFCFSWCHFWWKRIPYAGVLTSYETNTLLNTPTMQQDYSPSTGSRGSVDIEPNTFCIGIFFSWSNSGGKYKDNYYRYRNLYYYGWCSWLETYWTKRLCMLYKLISCY